MIECMLVAVHPKTRMRYIRPGVVGIAGNIDPIGVGAEGFFKKIGRADTIVGHSARRLHVEVLVRGFRVAGGQRDLSARDRQRLQHEASGWLPQPVADLFVKGDVLFGCIAVNVITQTVKQLRAVGLWIDRMLVVRLSKDEPLWSLSQRVQVVAFLRSPDTGQWA